MAPDRESEIKALQTKIGEITMVNDFCPTRSDAKPSRAQKKINRSSKLSLVKQCHTPDIARSGAYYQSKPAREVDQMLMRLIDEIHLAKPFLGIRRLKDALYDLDYIINRKRVQRLMRRMGIQTIYPRRI